MSRLTFPPSPFLGACVTVCDTPPSRGRNMDAEAVSTHATHLWHACKQHPVSWLGFLGTGVSKAVHSALSRDV